MVIEISPELFDDTNNLKDINFLVSQLTDNKRFDIFCDLTIVANSEVFSKLIEPDKEIIKQNFDRIINNSLKRDYIIGPDNGMNFLSIEEAKRMFFQPFIIILENSLYDKYFVMALVNNFQKKGKKIRSQIENTWINFENAGGLDNFKNVIEEKLQAYNSLPKDPNFYLRCFFIFDSDKAYPSLEPMEKQKKVIDYCILKKIRYHELTKREIENYLPDEVIKSISESDDYFQQYLNLSPIQRDYFDIEKGFDNKNITTLHRDIQELYSNLTQDQLGVLRKGCKNERFRSFKSEFSKLFESKLVTQEGLKSRLLHQSNSNELEYILDEITKLL